MSHEDWTNLLFDDIEIDVDDVVGIDFHAGSELAAEVQLKKEVDPSKYVGKKSELNNLIFEVSKVETDSTKVTFKSVPLNIPDEELIHLVKCYGGKMEKEQVEHEKLIKKTKKGHTVEFTSTTRYINATFPHPAHQHTNAGTPGTGPVYMEKCLRYELPAGEGGEVDLDLALVEYTQNNQYFADKVSLERLVRRLLALPSAPAVVLVS